MGVMVCLAPTIYVDPANPPIITVGLVGEIPKLAFDTEILIKSDALDDQTETT